VSSILKNNSDTMVSVVMMRVSSSEVRCTCICVCICLYCVWYYLQTTSSDVIDVLRERACQYMRSFAPVSYGYSQAFPNLFPSNVFS